MDEYSTVYDRIDILLNMSSFSLSYDFLIRINKYIFDGVYAFAGSIREVNLSKMEDVLDGGSIMYANKENIIPYLEYDFSYEKKKNYAKMTEDEVVDNITDFTIRLWLTHPFRDGNTRTISVFIRMYLKSLGYNIDNELFLKYFSFYRNSLVMACYEDYYSYGTREYLKLFYKKIIFDKNKDIDSVKIKKRIKP